jgi:hypothetical protein
VSLNMERYNKPVYFSKQLKVLRAYSPRFGWVASVCLGKRDLIPTLFRISAFSRPRAAEHCL